MEITKIVKNSFVVAQPTTLDVAAPLTLFGYPSNAEGVSWEPTIGDDPYTKHRRAILLEPDGSPWAHGNMFLLHLLKTETHEPSTDIGIAGDLQKVRNILFELDISYTADIKIKSKRPTYQVKTYFSQQIKDGLDRKYANRIIGVMVSFYNWLLKYTSIKFTYPLFLEKTYTSFYVDDAGFQYGIRRTTTDLMIKELNQEEIDKRYIIDGGKLQPLNLNQQKELIEALFKIGNTEMTLAFLIAMKTGARIMTVFTLRAEILRECEVEDDEEVPIKIGRNTNVSNKAGKQMVIYIPGWLHNRIKTYYECPRAVARRRLTSDCLPAEQYIFLTRTGNPYYIGHNDKRLLTYSSPPAGQSVRKFIAVQLIPALKEMKSELRLSFHDLRATFGMNYVRHGLDKIDNGKYSKSSLLNDLRQRMGHSKITTTMLYLDYDFADKRDFKIQEEWELSLINGRSFI